MQKVYFNSRDGVEITIQLNDLTIDDILTCRQLLYEAMRDFDAKLVSMCERTEHKEAWQ